jgi:hypothetical protein
LAGTSKGIFGFFGAETTESVQDDVLEGGAPLSRSPCALTMKRRLQGHRPLVGTDEQDLDYGPARSASAVRHPDVRKLTGSLQTNRFADRALSSWSQASCSTILMSMLTSAALTFQWPNASVCLHAWLSGGRFRARRPPPKEGVACAEVEAADVVAPYAGEQ